MTHLVVGATVVAMPRWDAREFVALVPRHRITNTFMVPTHFARLLELPDEERAPRGLSSLRLLLHGGAACPSALKERTLAAFPDVHIWEFYRFTQAVRLTRTP